MILSSRIWDSTLALLGLVACTFGQEPGREPPPRVTAAVDQRRVDEAVRRGVEYLKGAKSPRGPYGVKHSDELILLTFVHAGVPEGDPRFQDLFKKMMEGPLEKTYNVSLQAMILEEVDRARYQGRIAQCAQFLLDNQCKNGQWSYGEPISLEDYSVPPPVRTGSSSAPKGGVVDFGAAQTRHKPKVTRWIQVKKTRDGPDGGDNSNSQYAALGLRACHDAGITLPRDAVVRARDCWVKDQIRDGDQGKSVATGPGTPAGWCYRGHHHKLKFCRTPDQAYSSMTAGAVGALRIYDHILSLDWKGDRTLQNGLAWLAKNFSVSENVGPSEMGGSRPKTNLYYTLYALERVGMLCEVERIGAHEWYAEGARAILEAQNEDGSWKVSEGDRRISDQPTWDTCFAILFLRRATRSLRDVATVDRFHPR
jgi:hypothetical protein